jgi:hypothetical protein
MSLRSKLKMNSHQRRKHKRAGARMAQHLINVFSQGLGEIESGKTTIEKMRNGLNEVRAELEKLA